jgi:CubicO group peptidase (beta-lactamase class C family)
MKRVLFLSLLVMYFNMNVLKAQTLTQQQIMDIECAIKSEMEISKTPGVALSIIKNNRLMYESSFGLANSNTKVQMNDSTVFCIASCTKFFTALTLLIELKNADIDVNEPIGNAVKGLSSKLSSLTYHQLLSHTSGMIDVPYTNEPDYRDVYEFFRTIGDTILFIEPGRIFSYSNVGYALISLCIEQLSGKSFPAAVEDAVIKPLRLKNTTFDLFKAVCKSFSTGHYFDINKNMIIPAMNHFEGPLWRAGGGIFSNTQDLERLALVLLNNGNLDGEQLFDRAIIDKIMHPHSKNFAAPVSSSYYGLLGFPDNAYGYGSYMFEFKGKKIFALGGGGYQMSFIIMNNDSKFATIMLSNMAWDALISSLEIIYNVGLNAQKLISAEYKCENKEWNSISGRYIMPSISKEKVNSAVVFTRNEKLYINFNNTKDFELEQIGDWAYKYSDPSIRRPIEIGFYKNESNKIAYLRNFWRTWIKVE